MYIAISNSIGSSSNSGGTPLPATEYYSVNDCIGIYGAFDSASYPIGTLVVKDMVTFVADGQPGYGYVGTVTEGVNIGFALTATGANQEGTCNLSDINFAPVLIPSGNQILIRLQGNNIGPNNLTSEDDYLALTYNYDFSIFYTYGDGEEGDLFVSGSIVINNYDMEGESGFNLGDFVVYDFGEDIGLHTANFSGDVVTSTTFGHTTPYSDNEGCSYNYFLKDSGTTFRCYAQNDNCG